MKQKLADFFNLLFGFRKLIAWLSLFLVAIAFRLKGYVDGGQFVDLVKATFLGFVAGNGTEHLVSVAKEYINAKGKVVAAAPAPQGDDLVSGDDSEADAAESGGSNAKA